MTLATQVTVVCAVTGRTLAQATHPGASTSYRIARETVARYHPAIAEIRAVRSEERTTRGLFGVPRRGRSITSEVSSPACTPHRRIPGTDTVG